MKVAQVVSTFPPYKAGIGNAAFHISWQLASRHIEVNVFTLASRQSTTVDTGFPFKVRRLHPWIRYGNAGAVPQLLWQLRPYDIVHLHYPFFGGAEIIYFLERLRHLNFILHYHMDVVGEGVKQKIFNWHTNVVLPRIVRRASKIIVTSMDYARESAIKNYLNSDPDKFVEIPLGVNTDIFKPRMKNRDLVDKHSLNNKKVILFVGALDKAHYFKGINYLVKAFHLIASNDDYRLIIVGDGDLKHSYESLAVNYSLDRKIIFAGYIADDLLPLYYNLADVYVLPSIDRSEAFGISLLEAMSSGVATIVSDLAGVRSVVAKKETSIIVKPRDVSDIAKYLRYLLENPQVRNKLGHEGRLRVLGRYTWDIVGNDVEALYREILP